MPCASFNDIAALKAWVVSTLTICTHTLYANANSSMILDATEALPYTESLPNPLNDEHKSYLCANREPNRILSRLPNRKKPAITDSLALASFPQTLKLTANPEYDTMSR